MSKIIQIPFKQAHIEIINIRDNELKILQEVSNLEERLNSIEDAHSAMTLILDGRILAIAGNMVIKPGVMEVWMIPSTYVSENTLAFARLIKYYKTEVMNIYPWHRLQMVTPNDELHTRWAKFLDFDFEGILRKWGNNKSDHIMWSKVR